MAVNYCSGQHDDILGFVCPYGCNLKQQIEDDDDFDSILKNTEITPNKMPPESDDNDSVETSSDSETDYSSNDYSYDSQDSSECDFTEALEGEELKEDPGKHEFPLHALTSMDMIEHNRKYGNYSVWWKHMNSVYDVKRLYVMLSPLIRNKCREMGKTAREYRKIQNSIKYSFPKFAQIFSVAKILKLPLYEIDRAKISCKVGQLRIFTSEERNSEIQNGVEKVISCLEDEICPMLSDDPHQLEHAQSFLRLCEEFRKNPSYTFQIVLYGDPNQHAFPTPPWFDLDTIRSYLLDYEPFDTNVDIDLIGRDRIFEILTPDECHETFAKQLRPLTQESEPFDTTLEGTAWNTTEQDLVKNDILTPYQEVVLETRKNRKDFGNKDQMKERRNKLYKYFSDKYNYGGKIDKFKQWAESMEESEKRFLQLC